MKGMEDIQEPKPESLVIQGYDQSKGLDNSTKWHESESRSLGNSTHFSPELEEWEVSSRPRAGRRQQDRKRGCRRWRESQE